MWRLLQRILLFSLVFYCNCVHHEPIGDCPDDSVCAIFTDTEKAIDGGLWYSDTPVWCLVEGVKHNGHIGGFLWEGRDSCHVNYYDHFHKAFLTITPDTLYKWEFKMILWISDDEIHEDRQKITNVGFDFGKARFVFKNDEWLDFSWKNKADEWETSKINMTIGEFMFSGVCKEEWFSKYGCRYRPYTFTVESDEKLIDLFGADEFSFTRFQPGKKNMTLKDRRYREKLSNLLSRACDPKEVNQPCYETCEKLVLANNTAANCTMDLWYHDKDYSKYTRQWRKIDEIVCKVGRWRANWGGEKPGTQALNFERFEVQCADGMPSRMTALMSGIMIGGGVGGGLILITIVVVIGFLLFKKVKGNDNKETNRGTTRSESNAEGKSSKNTSNRIPGVSPTASSTPSKTTSPFTPRH